jgi:hypothetical protein
MKDKTSTLLVEDLKEHLKTIVGDDDDNREGIESIIEKAQDLWFDDYQSERTLPKMDLIRYLKRLPNTQDIVKNVEKGKYD